MLTLLRFAFQTTLYFPNLVIIICNFPPPTPPKKLLPSTIPICQSSYQNRNVVLTRSLKDYIFFGIDLQHSNWETQIRSSNGNFKASP